MTPRPLDRDVVGRRLRIIRQSLDDLEALRGVDGTRLRDEPLTRAAAERLIQVVVDVAVDVNGQLVVTASGEAPTTGRTSFLRAGDIGALDTDLAARLAPAAGLRNLLVHRYADIRVDLVAAAVGQVLDGFADYVGQVATYIGLDEPLDG